MKNNNERGSIKVITLGGIMILLIIVLFIVAIIQKNNAKKAPISGEPNGVSQGTEGKENTPQIIDSNQKIAINTQETIDSLTKYNINGTNDYFVITEKIVWKSNDSNGNTQVSGAFLFPYKFIINGIEYTGTYQWDLDRTPIFKNDDGNTKYEIKIIQLRNDNKVEIIIADKENNDDLK